MSGEEQRDLAVGLRETFGKVASDVSSKTAAFHDVTADAAQQSAHEMENTDSEFGNKLNELGNGPVRPATPRPSEPKPHRPGDGSPATPGPVTDEFHNRLNSILDPQASGAAGTQPDMQLFSRGGARSNTDVLANGGGVALTQEAVTSYASRAGVDLSGVDIHIVTDADEVRYLDFQDACACTPPELGGSQIRFGPAAFADEDTLVATIAHEYTHVLQLRSGVELSTGSIGDLEAEAYASESSALERFHGGQS